MVTISIDEFNAIQGKKVYHSYENGKMILEEIRFVDEVIPKNNWNQKVIDVIKNDIDIFVMNDDLEGKFDHLQDYRKDIYSPCTVGISTTKIKKALVMAK